MHVRRGRRGPASEQLDVHDLAGLDDVDLRRDLDVAVGVRHAGDVARRLERRAPPRRRRCAPYRTGAGPSSRRCAAPAAPRRCAAGIRAAAPSAAASARAACSRSTGTTSDSRACRAPACRRRARTPSACRASRRRRGRSPRRARQHVDDQIALADRAAAREHEHVLGERARRSPRDSASSVSGAVGSATGTPPCASMIDASVNRLMS